MSTDTSKPLTQEQADGQAVLDYVFKGKPIEPDVVRRVRARAEKVREGMRTGVETNIAVDLLHESRDE